MSIWEHVALDPQAAMRFVVEVAQLRMDGEGPDAEDQDSPWVMENDDAYDTVHTLIAGARELLGWEAGTPPLDTGEYRGEQASPLPASHPETGAEHDRERAANMNARFLPQRDDDESPAVDVAGALGIMYVKDGELYVAVSLDTADPAVYRIYGDQQVPLHISVQGDTVFEATGT